MTKILLALLLIASLAQAEESTYKMSNCFGRTEYKTIDAEKIHSIEYAQCKDKNEIKVYRVIINDRGLVPYLMNKDEMDAVLGNKMIIQEMHSQENRILREQLLLEEI